MHIKSGSEGSNLNNLFSICSFIENYDIAILMRDEDEELVSDIGYAIRKSGLRLQKGQRIEDCRTAARKVVIHLKKCLWKFERSRGYEPIVSSQSGFSNEDDKEITDRRRKT